MVLAAIPEAPPVVLAVAFQATSVLAREAENVNRIMGLPGEPGCPGEADPERPRAVATPAPLTATFLDAASAAPDIERHVRSVTE